MKGNGIKNTANQIEKLEDKIASLKIKLNNKTREFEEFKASNAKIIGKLIHNVKNPVGSIYSFSEMMLEGFESYTPEKTVRHLGIIKSSSSFVIKFMNSLAIYLQLNSNEKEFNIDRINLNNFLANLCESFKNEIELKNGNFQLLLPSESIFVNANLDYLAMAFKNILSNAIRYSADKIEITVELLLKGGKAEVVIKDKGIGIKKEDLMEVFNEFYSVNTYDADSEKCIGLGLPIAKKIIELHNGNLTVQSEINNGSEFKITLSEVF